jgi:heat shock protein HtpX
MAAVRNIYEQQTFNRRMSVIFVILFLIVLVLIGFAIDSLVLGLPSNDVPLPLVSIVMLTLGTGMAIWSLRSGWIAVLKSTGALPANPKDPLQKQLLNVVEEMKIAAGLPMPKVYVIPDYDFNALATGRDPQHCAIAVTDSLLQTVDRDELQGVVAHEMSHIKNYDIRLMTILASFVGGVILIGDFLTRSLKVAVATSERRHHSGWTVTADQYSSSTSNWVALAPLFFVTWLIGVVLAPLILKIMATAVSRSREYLADAAGAELSRNPEALARALKKIGTDRIPTFSMTQAAAHLCIVDPTGSGFNDREGFIAELFGTHPPLLKRIKRLDAMAYRVRPTGLQASPMPHS